MSSLAWAPEAFACPICLETLKDPATLPCGHTYCLLCIQKHWDKSATKGLYECPQCRQRFNPRPVLARSNVLMEAMEKLRLSQGEDPSSEPSPEEPCADGAPGPGLYPALPDLSPQLCPLHHQLLELYCCDDQTHVCDECGLLQHKGHDVVRPDEEMQRIQQELISMNAEIQGHIADRERLIQSLPQVSQAQQVAVQTLMLDAQAMFADVLKSIDLSRCQILELLQAHAGSSSAHTQAQGLRLQQEILALTQRRDELQRLSGIQEPITFLDAFKAVCPAGQADGAAMEILNSESVVSGVRSALDAFRNTAERLTKANLATVFRVVNDAAAQTSSQSHDRGVTTSQSHDGLITSSQSNDGRVTSIQSHDGRVTPSQSHDGRVTHSQSHDGRVTSIQSHDGRVTPSQSHDGRITSSQSHNGRVTSSQSNDGPVTSSQSHDGRATSIQSQASSRNPAPEVKSDATKPDVKPKVQASPVPAPKHQNGQKCPSASAAEGSASCCLSNPAPKTREEMLKFRIEPTLDHSTAFRHIRLSEGFRKASLCAENQNYPDGPERFMFWRQVMCVEPMAGSPYYWEVEWTGQRVTVGVAYKDMDRSSANDSARLGHNGKSWSLYWSGKAFSLWHDGKETVLLAPKAKRIGVYLDQQAGVLAFYRVSHGQAQEICSVHTHFDGPLLASFRFWSGVGSSITICQLD